MPAISLPSSEPIPTKVELLIECLERLNNQNKALLCKLSEFESKINKKCSEGESDVVEPNLYHKDDVTLSTQKLDEVTQRIEKLEKERIPPNPLFTDVSKRVEKLENNVNNHLLICRGSEVESKISKATVNGTINLNKIKAELCSELCGDTISEISVGSLSLSLFGKKKNILKIECSSIFVRNFILKQARNKKPKGIYVTEFLASEKLPVYRKLLELKRKTDKIKKIQIRGGKVFYKLESEDRFLQIDSLDEVRVMEESLTVADAGSDGESNE